VRVNNGSTGLNLPEEKQEAIARMHAAGVPVTRIASEVGVSYHSVAGLIRNRPDLLEAARDITSKNWRTLAALGTAQLVDRLPEMKDQALSVLAAIATEKAELLSGGATSRVEIVSAPSADEWLDVVDGVVIESAPLPTGNTGQTRAPKAHKRTQSPRLEGADGEQPPVSECSVTVGKDGVPVFEPEDARFLPPPPPTDGGGAGVRSSSRPSYPDSTDDEKFFSKS
jgi:transposase-like protein